MSLRKAIAAIVASTSMMLSAVAAAHCDGMDGPVVRDARIALGERDPTVVLKWVSPDREAEIREAFAKVLAVRGLGKAAEELSDLWFFETLVRFHRAGEGEPFTGLKPAGRIDPGIAAADAALESGAAAAGRLAKQLADNVLARGQQVHQQGRETLISEETCYAVVSLIEAAAATAMNEHRQCACVIGAVEESFELLAGADIDADRVEERVFHGISIHSLLSVTR